MTGADLLEIANRSHLDLLATIQDVPLASIEKVATGKYNKRYLASMAHEIGDAVDRGDEWPEFMPIPILAKQSQGKFLIIDGNHRIKAARSLRLVKVPALIVSWKTFLFLLKNYEIDEPKFVSLMAEVNQLVAENVEVSG